MTDTHFDPDAAAAKLLALPSVANDKDRYEQRQQLMAAALIDIAGSLQTLAVVGWQRAIEEGFDLTGGSPAIGDADEGGDEQRETDEPEHALEVGDWAVALEPADEDDITPSQIIAAGESEGESWVDFGHGRVWAKLFYKVPTPTPAAIDDDETDEPTGHELVDELDADFEGDSHPAAEAAVDELRKLETCGAVDNERELGPCVKKPKHKKLHLDMAGNRWE